MNGKQTHLVLIPSYNTGRDLLRQTVAGALQQDWPVWVVIDGSTDGSDTGLESLAEESSDGTPVAASAHKAPTAPTPQTAQAINAEGTTTVPQTTEGATATLQAAEGVAARSQVTEGAAQANPQATARLRVLRLPKNGGKGRAVYAGMTVALEAGFSHVLCFDADGQHPADAINPMMALSCANPQATIMGQPIFGSDAPAERLFGRKIANFFTEWESGHCGLGDTLFGMRVYRIEPSLAAMDATCFARRFDFDPEVAVRLCWQGVRPLPFPVRCRYLGREEGGVSHFNYVWDNIFQVLLHFRLLPRYLLGKWRTMRAHKQRWRTESAASVKSEGSSLQSPEARSTK